MGACYTGVGQRGYAAYSAFRGCYGSWLSPPGFHLMPDWLLAIAYLVATIWLFFGVAIAADIFMVGCGAPVTALKSNSVADDDDGNCDEQERGG